VAVSLWEHRCDGCDDLQYAGVTWHILPSEIPGDAIDSIVHLVGELVLGLNQPTPPALVQ